MGQLHLKKFHTSHHLTLNVWVSSKKSTVKKSLLKDLTNWRKKCVLKKTNTDYKNVIFNYMMNNCTKFAPLRKNLSPPIPKNRLLLVVHNTVTKFILRSIWILESQLGTCHVLKFKLYCSRCRYCTLYSTKVSWAASPEIVLLNVASYPDKLMTNKHKWYNHKLIYSKFEDSNP